MRLFVGGICQETNSLSPVPTALGDFRIIDPAHKQPKLTEAMIAVAFGLSEVVAAARETPHELVIGFYADADPSQPISREGYESMRSRLVETFVAAGPVDAILLFMHGAQVAQGYPDCEGETLRALREVAGPRVPIGVLLDLHTNLTPEMVQHATILSTCWEYPHVDFKARSTDLIAALQNCVAGVSKPVMHVQPIAAIALLPTVGYPGCQLLEALTATRNVPGVLSASLCHGFALANVPAVGAAAIVVTEGRHSQGAAMARSLAMTFLGAARRSIAANPPMDRETALDRALMSDRFPVVIADRADNPGGGAPADATYFLDLIRRRQARDIALGVFCSTETVQRAGETGVGNRGSFRLCGTSREASGPAFEFDARVTSWSADVRQKLFGVGPWRPLGRSASLEHEGVDIVVNDIRQQVHSRECFADHGIDVMRRRILIVKSMAHFLTDFSKFSPLILFADGPGAASMNLRSLHLNNIRRPLWPLDDIDDTIAMAGSSY